MSSVDGINNLGQLLIYMVTNFYLILGYMLEYMQNSQAISKEKYHNQTKKSLKKKRKRIFIYFSTYFE